MIDFMCCWFFFVLIANVSQDKKTFDYFKLVSLFRESIFRHKKIIQLMMKKKKVKYA